jgi:peptidoglycan DL-endopeptidase CwlO
MQINPKTWNKKQKITAGVVVAVLILGSIGGGIAVHQQNVHAQQIKVTQAKEKAAKAKAEKLKAEKEAETKAEKVAQAQLMTTEKAPTTDNIKKSETAISKVKAEKVKSVLNTQLKDIQSRVALENTAKTKTNAYQADAMNTDKYNQAKTAISKLTSMYSVALKNKLTQDLADSKAQADKARKAQSDAQDSKEQAATATTTPPSTAATNDSSDASGSYVGAGSQAPASTNQTPAYTAPATPAPTPSAPSNQGNAPSSWQSGHDVNSVNQQESNANTAGTNNAVNKEPGAKW